MHWVRIKRRWADGRLLRRRRIAWTSSLKLILPTGITSAEAFGTANISNRSITPSGITSAEAFGTARTGRFVLPTGIATAENTGIPELSNPTYPDFTVEVAFTTNPGSVPAWTNITDYVRSVSIRRGRSHELDRPEAGTCVIVLANHDRRFDPSFSSGSSIEVVNLITNPSFEVNLTGWSAAGSGTSVARNATDGVFGSACLEVIFDGAGANCGAEMSLSGLTPGATYTLSGYMKRAAGAAGTMNIDVYEGGVIDTSGIQLGSGQTTAAGGWERFSETFVYPLTGSGTVLVRCFGDGTPAGSVRFDGIMLQAGSLTAYVDGDQSGDAWTGTSHASTSGPQTTWTAPYDGNVRPMRRVRVSATWNGTTYRLFSGYAEAWVQQYPDRAPNIAWCELRAVDGFKVLALKKLNATYTDVRPGSRIGSVLDTVGWPSSDRTLASGAADLAAVILENVPALEHLQSVAETENGRLFVDTSGAVVFKDRRQPYSATTPNSTYGDGTGEWGYMNIELQYGDEQIWNEVRVTRAGGTEQVANSTASQASYLTRTLERSGLLMDSDNEAKDAADFLLSNYKDPAVRVLSLQVWPLALGTGGFAEVLSREIGDRVRIKRRPPGGGAAISQDSFIEGIEHELTPDTWTTTFRYSAIGAGYSVGSGIYLDTATLDTTGVLIY